MRARYNALAADVRFDSEAPTRESSSELAAYARESEIILAQDRPTRPPSGARALVARDVPLDAIPVIAIAAEDLAWFELEPRALRIVARIDGRATLGAIIADLSLCQALDDMSALIDQGIVALR
jgi:hypothetical protein